jgi:ABC-2 type transport system permease protein
MLVQKPYSQFRAMMAIASGAFKAIVRSPSAVVFSLGFPLIFIMVFGLIGGGGNLNYKLVLAPGSDTANLIFQSLRQTPFVKFVKPEDEADLQNQLKKGRITGILHIHRNASADSGALRVQFKGTTASSDKIATFLPFLENLIGKIEKSVKPPSASYARLDQPQIDAVRKYRTIDFILPGQLGFSLLSAGVFGVAFLFFNLRQTLVLKRFYATPIRRGYIVLGEGLARVTFQMMTAVVILLIGHYFFQFTLINGWVTFLEVLALCFLALVVFIGFGFIVSSVAKTESSIPPFANLITMPQFLLAGTFFNIDVFPAWLQPICRALPLTFFNDAMRKISFEGAHLTDTWFEMTMLLAWGIAIYAVAIRVFKWE